jgi:hypothetical protein
MKQLFLLGILPLAVSACPTIPATCRCRTSHNAG